MTAVPVVCGSCGAKGRADLSKVASLPPCCATPDHDIEDAKDDLAVDWLLLLRQLQKDGMSFEEALAEANHRADEAEKKLTPSKTASDDLGPGSGGVLGLTLALWEQLKLALMGGDRRIPKWFPKRLLLPEEARSGLFINTAGGSVSGLWASKQSGWNGTVAWASKTAAPKWYEEGIVGRQPLGFPGAEVLSVEPTGDYLTHGPVGDGWYEPGEDRYVTTDFIITVRLEDGRVVQLPKSYAWLERNQKKGEGVLSSKTAFSESKSNWAIYRRADGRMVYGPVPREDVNIAVSSGRYPEPDYYTAEAHLPPEDMMPTYDETPLSGDGHSQTYQMDTMASRKISKGQQVLAYVMATNPDLSAAEARKITLKVLDRYPVTGGV